MINDLCRLFNRQWPSISGKELFAAWQEASMIYPHDHGISLGIVGFSVVHRSMQESTGSGEDD